MPVIMLELMVVFLVAMVLLMFVFIRAMAADTAACVDTNDSCAGWGLIGECAANQEWMDEQCPRTCGVCAAGPGDAPSPFAKCLDQGHSSAAPGGPPISWSVSHPLFTGSRVPECIYDTYAHMSGGAHFVPTSATASAYGGGGRGDRPKEFGFQQTAPTQPIAEVDCAREPLVAPLVARLRDAIARSVPVVFRGCSARMGAVERWQDDNYLSAWPDYFRNILEPDTHGGTSPGQLPDGVIEDLAGSPFIFAAIADEGFGRPSGWVSVGDKRADTHFDTFENIHTMVSGSKIFRLVSPAYSAHMYLDFKNRTCSDPAHARGRPGVVPGCPEQSAGCDGLGQSKVCRTLLSIERAALHS